MTPEVTPPLRRSGGSSPAPLAEPFPASPFRGSLELRYRVSRRCLARAGISHGKAAREAVDTKCILRRQESVYPRAKEWDNEPWQQTLRKIR